jgi:glycerol-3-phosphate acyltransferase PlsY
MHPAELFTFALILIPAYLLGSVPFGLIIGRIGGIDVRKHGSGNIGATNVWRVLGQKWGGATFLLDAGKGFAAVRLAENIACWRFPQPVPEDYLAYAAVFAALACILGHTFPVWLRFKGGKGVATSLGVLLAVMPLIATGTVLAVWMVAFSLSRYVSLASILAALALPITVGALLLLDELQGRAYLAFACAAAFLVVRRHRENMKRLFAGTESRFGKSNA